MKLEALTLRDAQRLREWRNEDISVFRTPYLLTEKMQEDFYYSLNRNSKMRYWAIKKNDITIGVGGLVNIEWENRLAEISLVVVPECRGRSYSNKVVDLILHEGFNNMNLVNIYGECYECNPSINFWKNLCSKYNATYTILPNRKYWNGQYWNSFYFNFERGLFNA